VLTETQAVRNQIAEAQKVASGGGSEVDRAEANIEIEVRQSFPLHFAETSDRL